MQPADLSPDNLDGRLGGAAGVLAPGGFGHRGIEGKVLTVATRANSRFPTWACDSASSAHVIEFAHGVVGKTNANSTEFDLFTSYPVILHA